MGEAIGSIYLRDQNVPIPVPRGRNHTDNEEVPLRSYEPLQEPGNWVEGVLKHGSSRDLAVGGVKFVRRGTKSSWSRRSTVSKRHIRASQYTRVESFVNGDWRTKTLVALILYGRLSGRMK